MKYKKVVVLTGAGISQESGLKTFRGDGGLWEGQRVEDVATPEAFIRNPERVLEFYNQRRRQLLSGNVHPNAAHMALAEFEENFPGEFLLITQNIDDLHERAGSKNLIHLHGSLLKARCIDTGEVFDWTEDLTLSTPHPAGSCEGRLRPHIVWFGEIPFELGRIEQTLRYCDLFIAIGTSGNVYPAAGFVQGTPHFCHRVEINLESTPVGMAFHEQISGKATEKVPTYLQSLLTPI